MFLNISLDAFAFFPQYLQKVMEGVGCLTANVEPLRPVCPGFFTCITLSKRVFF